MTRSPERQTSFALGLAIVVVFLALQSVWASWLYSVEFVRPVLIFLNPGWSKQPSQQLLGQSIISAIGIAGILLLSRGADLHGMLPLASEWRRLMRAHWRQALWFFLLGSTSVGLLHILLSPLLPSASPNPRGIEWLLAWGSRLSSVIAFCCYLRLLFGRQRRRFDGWLGYAMAAIAVFQIVWPITMAFGSSNSWVFGGMAGGSSKVLLWTMVGVLPTNVATAWSGLFLARETRAPLRHAPASIIVLLLLTGSSLASFYHRALSSVLVLLSTPSSLQIVELPLEMACAAFIILVMLNAVAEVAPPTTIAEELPDAASAAHRVPLMVFLTQRAFWFDTVKGLCLAMALMGIGFGALARIPIGILAFLIPILMFAAYAGPAAIVVVAVLRRRPGYALGAFLLVGGLTGYRLATQTYYKLQAQSARIDAEQLNVYPFAEPAQSHSVIAIEDSWFGRPEGAQQGCDQICDALVTISEKSVAIVETDGGGWRLYRKVHDHDLCTSPDNLKSYFVLMGRGILDSCIIMSRQAAGTDAMIVRENYSQDAPIKKQLPERFAGQVFELLERSGGQDRLLGRLLLTPQIVGNNAAPAAETSTPRLKPEQFYARALGFAELKLPQPDRKILPAALTALMAHLQDPAIVNDPPLFGYAADALRAIARLGKEDSEVAKLLQPPILALLAMPDTSHVLLGQNLLAFIKQQDLSFAKSSVLRGLTAADPVVRRNTITALNTFQSDDLEFAVGPLGDTLLTDDEIYKDDGADRILRLVEKIPHSFTPQQRSAAKQRLQTRQDLTVKQRAVLLAVTARGDAALRQQMIDYVFGLKGEPFENMVIAIASGGAAIAQAQMIGDTNVAQVNFWAPGEMAKLVEKATEVPPARLLAYIDAIRFQMSFKPSIGDVQDILYSAAEAADGDPELAKQIKRYAKRLD